jgi:hypothetical protein
VRRGASSTELVFSNCLFSNMRDTVAAEAEGVRSQTSLKFIPAHGPTSLRPPLLFDFHSQHRWVLAPVSWPLLPQVMPAPP